MDGKDDKLSKYPSTDIFRVKDTIGVPHPYCITGGHVAYVSDHFSGMLSNESIREAEKHKYKNHKPIKCGVKGCNLSYDEHKQALLIEVKSKEELKDVPGLREYLLSIKEMAEADGYAGFTFVQG